MASCAVVLGDTAAGAVLIVRARATKVGTATTMTGRVGILCALLLMPIAAAGQENASVRQRDRFMRRHDHDAATNPLPYAFTISFADARRAFHPGEPIKLTFRFYVWRGPIYHANQYCLEFGDSEAVFDRTDGITIPHQITGEWVSCGFASGVRGGIAFPNLPPGGVFMGLGGSPSPLAAKPFTVPQPEETYTAYLNHVARVDRPGHYRFYARSPAGSFTAAPIASNILEFDMLPRDVAWERQAVTDAIRTLDANPSNRDAVATLRFLGTEASVAEIARRFGDLPRSDESDWRLALAAAPDRRRTIHVMQAEIDRADRSVSDHFIRLTAGLVADAAGPEGAADRFRVAVEVLSRRRLAALSKVNVLAAELRGSFDRGLAHNGGLEVATAHRGWKFFPQDVERVLHTFSPFEQKLLLLRGWREFADPAFVPMFRRIVDTTTAVDGPQDVALREWYEADPRSGRAAILRELAKTQPATTTDGTGVLPDAELPQFDGVFADALERVTNPFEYRRAIDRVERYASGRIASRVQTVYARWPDLHDCESGPVALAYFFRVDPAFANAEIHRVRDTIVAGPDCEAGVLFAAAKRRMTPALENAAIGTLHDSTAYLQTDAVRALGAYGSAKALPALWDAFDEWHRRWRDSDRKWPELLDNRRTWDEALGDAFALALVQSVAWHLDQEGARRGRVLCLTRYCDYLMDDAERDAARLDIYAMPRRSLARGPAFAVSSALSESRLSLMQFVETFPKGTTFTWHTYAPDWEPDELEKEFRRIKAMLETRGMKLAPYVFRPEG